MDASNVIDTHDLFGALTRPAMMAGVTFEYHSLNVILSMAAFIGFGNLLYGLMFVPLHILGWIVCREEALFFTICYKRVMYIPNSPNKFLWGVACYEPS